MSSRIEEAIASGRENLPAWWESVSEEFRNQCRYIAVPNWEMGSDVSDLSEAYKSRFDEEVVEKRIPKNNLQRADICTEFMLSSNAVMDIGSGLGEFVNLLSKKNKTASIVSVDVKDYALWFAGSDRIERVYKSIFDLTAAHECEVVTCFEVIEHLPADRLIEAIGILRSLAKKKLYISVPFMEPIPIYKGHFSRFEGEDIKSLFPEGKYTILGKGGKQKDKVLAWIIVEIDMDGGG